MAGSPDGLAPGQLEDPSILPPRAGARRKLPLGPV